MVLEYLPTFTLNLSYMEHTNVGKYAIHGAYGIAIENGSVEIVSLPIHSIVIFHGYMLGYDQRVLYY